MTVHQFDTRLRVKGVHAIELPDGFAMTATLARLLAHGGKFIPTPPAAPPTAFMAAMDMYRRAVRLRFQFSDRPYDARYHVPNSAFQPRHAPAAVEQDLRRLHAAFSARASSPWFRAGSMLVKSNLPPPQRDALRALASNAEVIIKPADKNLGLTLVGRAWYLQECHRQLNDASTYQRVHHLDVGQVLQHACGLVQLLRSVVPPTQYRWLHASTRASIAVPEFYILPKLHKCPVKGRPIVASKSWVTTPLSAWCSHRLNDVVPRLSTVLRDTPDLQARLSCLRFYEVEPITMFTADVESLYTSIPIPAALEAVHRLAGPLLSEPALLRPLLECIKFVLEHNFFRFDGQIYHQIRGLAMGTPLAPPVANIFMAFLEEHMFTMNPALLPCFYGRFLDDILVIVRGHEIASDALWLAMCGMHTNIHLTRVVSSSAVPFLDLVVFRRGDRLAFRVHQKVLNRYMYVTPNSFHPRHVLRGFIRTELMRYARNSSYELDFLKICRAFNLRLLERGFHPRFLRQVFSSVQYPMLPLQRSVRASPIVFKVPYSPANWFMSPGQLLHEWYTNSSEELKLRVPAPVVCYLLPSSLYKLLVRARVPTLSCA